jgi:hypothetical protein
MSVSTAITADLVADPLPAGVGELRGQAVAMERSYRELAAANLAPC